jgi:RHS repeat-associated protein
VNGIARSISVMPGDTVKMEVYAKYVDANNSNNTAALTNLLAQIVAGTASAGTVIDGANYSTNGITPFPYAGLAGEGSSTGTGPKSYMNWLVFDRNFTLVNAGYVRMSTAAKEDGSNVPHEKLSGQVVINQPGYVYVYLSNENPSPVECYFDDFKVTQVKSPIIQQQDFMPFGLTFNSYQRENSVPNNYLFNQGAGAKKFLTERINDLGLNVDFTKFRVYDPAMGRFWQIDPKADHGGQESWSPYQYAFNNPILHDDPFGDEIDIKYGGFLGIGRKTVVYDANGNLTTKNGQAFTGKVSGYLGKVVSALNTVRGNGGQAGVSQLANSKFTFNIQRGSNSFKEDNTSRAGLARQAPQFASMAGSGGTIRWSPSNTTGGADQSGSTSRPSFVGLSHEMGHAMAAESGTSDFSKPSTTDPAFQNVTNDEHNAAHFENIIRSGSHLPLREFYGKDSSGNPVLQFLNPGTNVNAQTGYVY